MSFISKLWKDRVSDYPNKRKLTKEDGTSETVTVERAEGDIVVAGDAFNAENMNDLETRIQNGFNAVEQAQAELNENLGKNTFGDKVTLVKDQNYICPSDGYFHVVCGYQEKSRAVGFINDINLVALSSTNSSSVVINNSMASIIFVRAGMTIKYTGTNAQGYFIPLI